VHGTTIRPALKRLSAICSSPSNFFSGGRTVVANRLTTHILQVLVQFIGEKFARGTQRRRRRRRRRQGIDCLQHDFVASYTHWISVSQGASSEGTAAPTPNPVL